MLLKKAQMIATVVFIVLMFINILGGISITDSSEVFMVYFKVYGIHLSIILTFYFSQRAIENKSVPSFSLGLLLFLLFSWNAMIMWITIDSQDSIDLLKTNLNNFPTYASFLIAGGIVWLFNGKVKG